MNQKSEKVYIIALPYVAFTWIRALNKACPIKNVHFRLIEQ